MALLDVEDLHVHFRTARGIAKAVDGISFSLAEGETHVLVGESGCGKSVTSLALMGLLPALNCRVFGRRVDFLGQNLLRFRKPDFRSVRGSQISMIFQEPMTALNPVMRVGKQIVEVIRLHPERSLSGSADEASMKRRAIELIEQTGLPDPAAAYQKYPHELSGGMRQRIMIAIALACRPKILIADEPTTALDVTIQSQILALMKDLQKTTGTAMLFITHNLGVAAQIGHRISVMYAGQIVEQGSLRDVFDKPCHPYTKALFQAIPDTAVAHRGHLAAIPGSVPPATDYDNLPSCRFFPRCQFQDDRCFERDEKPDHISICGRKQA